MRRSLVVLLALSSCLTETNPGTDSFAGEPDLLSPDAESSDSTSSAPSASWLSVVQGRLGVESRRFRERDGRFTVTVGKLRAELSADGLTATRGDDEVGLWLDSWGRVGSESRSSRNRVEPIRPDTSCSSCSLKG